jgi:hypothetical protein
LSNDFENLYFRINSMRKRQKLLKKPTRGPTR